MSDQAEEDRPVRNRMIGHLHPDESSLVVVAHVWSPDPVQCDNCGKTHPDHGLISLLLSEILEEDGVPAGPPLPGEEDLRQARTVTVMLDPGETLFLAERLTRAAGIVAEAQEDPPDLDREMTRYAPDPCHRIEEE